MKVLVTGAAGFIGSRVTEMLLQRGDTVLGIDNLNDYYEVSLKEARLKRIGASKDFEFRKIEIADRGAMDQVFREWKPQRVIHLAAQAGVRYSSQNPYVYIDSNIMGTLNILEGCRHNGVDHLVYASTSSVYGANTAMPFSVHHGANHPLSLYAATKKANEMMAHSYSALYGVPTTGLRFFTVYGPWGRPDMALFLFTKNILAGKPIQVFNNGNHTRDFTYIDDIAEGVVRVTQKPATASPEWNGANPDSATSPHPYRLYNIGSHRPVQLLSYIKAIEDFLGKKAIMEMLPLQAGDVPDTFADVDDLVRDFDYQPNTTVREGVERFVTWYRDYYKV